MPDSQTFLVRPFTITCNRTVLAAGQSYLFGYAFAQPGEANSNWTQTMEQPPPVPVVPTADVPPPRSSFFAKAFNIFAVPGDVFEEIRTAPAATANWLVPILVSSLLGIVASLIIFDQPNIQQQLREQNARAIDRQVKAGKLSQAEADQRLAMSEKYMGPAMLKVFGSVFGTAAAFIRLFWWGFILWLFSRWFLHTPVGYLKTLEVCGLAALIAVLGGIIGLLLQMNLDRLMVTPSAALLVSEFDVTRKAHWFLAAANPFYFWQVGIMGFGLAKLVGSPVWRAAMPVTAFWLIQESALILAGLGQFAM